MNAWPLASAALASAGSVRPLLALAVLTAYGLFCGAVWQRHRARSASPRASCAGEAPLLIVHASQTGLACELARQAEQALQVAGTPVRRLPLEQLDATQLRQVERALFIVSTYGAGDAPDTAAAFERMLMRSPLHHLGSLHAGVLALGDRSYAEFCAFGRRLDTWLQASGAQALFERIEVDRGNDTTLLQWRHEVARLAGTGDLPDWRAPAFERWRLVQRRLLNQGSAGAPLYLLTLVPHEAALPDWRSGDLAQVMAPSDRTRPREYSVASVPQDGHLQLVVRQERHADGQLGHASGWLTEGLEAGAVVELRLRKHAAFRLGANIERPLILVGNGSGIAGLRSHLKARALAGKRRNWLVFGERNAQHDSLFADELQRWRSQGLLERCDPVFSRDGSARPYVQDLLLHEAPALRAWVAAGAALYVCGSLQGMAAGVDAALRQVLGDAQLIQLAEAGRYRRDVY